MNRKLFIVKVLGADTVQLTHTVDLCSYTSVWDPYVMVFAESAAGQGAAPEQAQAHFRNGHRIVWVEDLLRRPQPNVCA